MDDDVVGVTEGVQQKYPNNLMRGFKLVAPPLNAVVSSFGTKAAEIEKTQVHEPFPQAEIPISYRVESSIMPTKSNKPMVSGPATPRDLLFLSWSGELGSEIAKLFYNFWTTEFPQFQDQLFYSGDSIRAGDDFRSVLDKALKRTKVMVVFITKHSLKNQGWIMYEAGSVNNTTSAPTRILPVLVDLTAGAYEEQKAAYELLNAGALGGKQLVKLSLIDAHGADSLFDELRGEFPFMKDPRSGWAIRVDALQAKVVSFIKAPDSSNSSKHDTSQILERLKGVEDDGSCKFSRWAAAYHEIFHWGRHAVIHALEIPGSLSDVKSKLLKSLPTKRTNDKEPDSLINVVGRGGGDVPHSNLVSIAIHQVLARIAKAFTMTLSPEDSRHLIVCLRDLREDGNYHTLFRLDKDGNTAPTPRFRRHWRGVQSSHGKPSNKAESAVLKLWKRIEDQETQPDERDNPKCVIHLRAEEVPKPHPKCTRHNYAKSMLMGAVMAKESVSPNDADVDQAGLWGLLCVSSHREDAFEPGHERLLQACNDMLSTVLNTLLRVKYLVFHAQKAEQIETKRKTSRRTMAK